MLVENAELKITPYDTPWEVACMLINAEYEGKNLLNQNVVNRFLTLMTYAVSVSILLIIATPNKKRD